MKRPDEVKKAMKTMELFSMFPNQLKIINDYICELEKTVQELTEEKERMIDDGK